MPAGNGFIFGNPSFDWGYESVPQSGLIKISPAENYCEVSRVFVEAAQQAGAVLNPDFNAHTQVGVDRFDAKVFNGQRQSTCRIGTDGDAQAERAADMLLTRPQLDPAQI